VILIYSKEAKDSIRSLPPEIKQGIKQIIESLQMDPYLGKPLQKELAGFYSARFKRYRVIYKIDWNEKKLKIYLAAPRGTVYEELKNSLLLAASISSKTK
jgi:mRNA-degrading endonuclease RelE of RelBE toxin-antitoxin system